MCLCVSVCVMLDRVKFSASWCRPTASAIWSVIGLLRGANTLVLAIVWTGIHTVFTDTYKRIQSLGEYG